MMMWVLAANGYRVEYDFYEHEAVILAVAAGEMGFGELTNWLLKRVRRELA